MRAKIKKTVYWRCYGISNFDRSSSFELVKTVSVYITSCPSLTNESFKDWPYANRLNRLYWTQIQYTIKSTNNPAYKHRQCRVIKHLIKNFSNTTSNVFYHQWDVMKISPKHFLMIKSKSSFPPTSCMRYVGSFGPIRKKVPKMTLGHFRFTL